MARTAFQVNPKLLHVVTRREAGDQFNIAAVAASGIQVKQRWTFLAARVHQLLEYVH
jgi:hypothetical protein